MASSTEDADPSSSNSKTEVKTNKNPEKLTSLPAVVTDEEGVSIPEAAMPGTSMYQYRDFSNVPEEELEQQPNTAPPPPSSRGPVESSIRVQKFPVKLYAILAQREFQDIITWMPHGRSWKVIKPNLFESLVMPLFFEYSNYHSFNRLVNAWSFRRISSGPDRGSYYHELFLRGKPYLQKYMRRLPKTHKKLPMKKDDEPDFYAMDKANPLPTVDEAPFPPGVPGPASARGGGGSPNSGPMGASAGMGAVYKDPLLSRHHHHMSGGMNAMGGMGIGMGGMNPMGGMGMSGGVPGMMGGMNSMSQMSGMGMGPGMMPGSMPPGGMMPGMGGMDMIGGMGSMNSMGMGTGSMSPMGGMSAYRDPQFGGPASDMEFQRLRQIQQMHMLDRQMGNADPLDRMRSMEMRLGR